MANVHDVAAYILAKLGRMSSMKLQKLVYYSQAWHLAWEGEPLFPERIEAWVAGPLVYELYEAYRGTFSVREWPLGNADALTPLECGTVDEVMSTYGKLTGRQLFHLIRGETPWRDARFGLRATDPCRREIAQSAIRQYYSALDADEEAGLVEDIDWSAWESPAPKAG